MGIKDWEHHTSKPNEHGRVHQVDCMCMCVALEDSHQS